MKKVAILQSNYIPWKGYFDIINKVDEFILYDDVQYTRRDWRNRNKIKTEKGTLWLTIPVQVKGKYLQKTQETVVDGVDWIDKHFKSISFYYARSKYHDEISPVLLELYQQCKNLEYLSQINYLFIKSISKLLNIKTKFSWSSDYELLGDRSARLLNLCIQAGATEYISGPAAKSYLDESLFAAKGISVAWMVYDGYPVYQQLFSPPFIHEVCILDLLFNEGIEGSRIYMHNLNSQ